MPYPEAANSTSENQMQDVLDMDLEFGFKSITGGSDALPSLPGQIHPQCRVPGSAFGQLLQYVAVTRVTATHYINPTSDQQKSESSSATPKSKYVQLDTVDGIQKPLRSR